MKLKNLLPEDKVSDTIKELYPLVSKMIIVRVHIYGDHKFNPAFKETKKTVRIDKVGGNGGYIVELKKAVRVEWKGKTPITLSHSKAKWEVMKYKLEKYEKRGNPIVGSNPTTNSNVGVAKSGNAQDCKSCIRRFNSYHRLKTLYGERK